MKKLIIQKNELITALLYTKISLVGEDFLTNEEFDHYIQTVKKELNKEKEEVILELKNKTNKEDFYKENAMIKSSKSIRELINKYGVSKNSSLLFLYNRKFQQKVLKSYYQSKIDRINIILDIEERKIKALTLNE